MDASKCLSLHPENSLYMNKQKRNIILGTTLAIVLAGSAFAGAVYHYFFAKPFQITEATYIYIDRDDNIDSVYHKIIEQGKPKQMFGFEYQAEKNDYANHIRTGKYAIKPSDNMRYLYRRLSMGYQTPVKLTG